MHYIGGFIDSVCFLFSGSGGDSAFRVWLGAYSLGLWLQDLRFAVMKYGCRVLSLDLGLGTGIPIRQTVIPSHFELLHPMPSFQSFPFVKD